MFPDEQPWPLGGRAWRVPLLVWFGRNWRHLAPGRPSGGGPSGRRGRRVDGVDLPATALVLMGIQPPEHLHGRPFLGAGAKPRDYAFSQRSRMDERYDLQRAVRDQRYLYVRNYLPHRPYGQQMGYMWQQKSYQEWEPLHLDGALDPVRDRFWNPKPAEELYDVETDPDCVQNLVDSPVARHRAALARMRRALDRHLLDTNDNGFIPESHPADRYLQSRAAGAYPIERVLAVAGLAIRRDPADLDALVGHLSSDAHDIVRYWAAQGLLMLGGRAAEATGALADVLAHDPSVYVRIPAAEALARMGDTAESWRSWPACSTSTRTTGSGCRRSTR